MPRKIERMADGIRTEREYIIYEKRFRRYLRRYLCRITENPDDGIQLYCEDLYPDGNRTFSRVGRYASMRTAEHKIFKCFEILLEQEEPIRRGGWDG
jgi:hypothetical protein